MSIGAPENPLIDAFPSIDGLKSAEVAGSTPARPTKEWLEWASRKRRKQQKQRRSNFSRTHCVTALTARRAKLIKVRLARGEHPVDIAAYYEVPVHVIQSVKHGRSWSCVPWPNSEPLTKDG